MQSEANHLLVSKIERKEKAMRRGDEFAILFVESGITPMGIIGAVFTLTTIAMVDQLTQSMSMIEDDYNYQAIMNQNWIQKIFWPTYSSLAIPKDDTPQSSLFDSRIPLWS